VNDPVTVKEGAAGSAGQATFTITLDAPSGKTVQVNYATVDGTAIAGEDYQAVSGTFTFSPGQTVKRVTVNFIGDTKAELNEAFFLDLKTPVNATVADSRGRVYVRNDDGGEIFIDDAPPIFEENSGTTAQTFIVRLAATSPNPNTVTVDWTTANGTAGPADYVVASGTLSFAPGETSKTITVQVKGDTTVEPTETYKVNLTHPTFAVIGDSQGIAYIKNDDGPQIFIDDALIVNEGDSGTTLQAFTVRLDVVSTSTVTVDFATADGTAKAGEDYVARSGRLTFMPGEVRKTIAVQVNGDTVVEPNEAYRVELKNPTLSRLGDSQGVGYIRNDDTASANAIRPTARNVNHQSLR